MELRAYEVGGGVAVKMPPTVRPADIMGPPESAGSSGLSSGRGRPSRSDPMSGSTSNGKSWSPSSRSPSVRGIGRILTSYGRCATQ